MLVASPGCVIACLEHLIVQRLIDRTMHFVCAHHPAPPVPTPPLRLFDKAWDLARLCTVAHLRTLALHAHNPCLSNGSMVIDRVDEVVRIGFVACAQLCLSSGSIVIDRVDEVVRIGFVACAPPYLASDSIVIDRVDEAVRIGFVTWAHPCLAGDGVIMNITPSPFVIPAAELLAVEVTGMNIARSPSSEIPAAVRTACGSGVVSDDTPS
jgi:hypothetical protein